MCCVSSSLTSVSFPSLLPPLLDRILCFPKTQATQPQSSHLLTSSFYQAPTPQPLLFLLSVSPPVSGRQHAASRLRLEKSVLSSHRSSSRLWLNVDMILILRLALRGSITSCK